MMPRLLPAIMICLSACSSGGGDAQQSGGHEAPAPDDGVAAVNVVAPANVSSRSLEDISGAIPGPCGAARAEAFLGKVYDPKLGERIKAASGASAIRVASEETANAPSDPRRLNVALSNSGRIVLMDCG